MKKFNIIVAVNNNGIIGNKGTIPWHCSEDLKHFKELTIDNTVIMGRKTFQSLNEIPLRNRENIVISHNKNLYKDRNDVLIANSLDNALKLSTKDNIFVIGGESVYLEALNHNFSDKLIISYINNNSEGDTYFPLHSSKKKWYSYKEIQKNDGKLFKIVYAIKIDLNS